MLLQKLTGDGPEHRSLAFAFDVLVPFLRDGSRSHVPAHLKSLWLLSREASVLPSK